MKKEKKTSEEKASSNPILEGLAIARRSSKPRKFTQTWDFCINMKGLNLKKPEHRFSVDVALPHGRGKEPKVAIFADVLAGEAEKVADVVVKKDEIPGLAKDKKRMGEITACDIFLGESSLMAMIGKELGQLLAPRGKMPRPMPPNVKLDVFLAASKRATRVALKESPTIHVSVGNDKMPDANVAANAEVIFNIVRDKLPKGINNVRSVYIKLTMGKPIKLALR
jgi:large subunit ribosomal protein L1